MREAHLRYLLAAALVVVAGYGVYTAAPQADESPGESAGTTPTGAPTGTPIPTEEPSRALAPGLTWDGVTDASNLGDAHTDRLRNTSYTVVAVQTTVNDNYSIHRTAASHAHVGAGGSPVYFAWNTSGVPPGPGTLGSDVAVWHNDTHSFARYVDRNGTATYRRSAPERDVLGRTPGHGAFVRSLFEPVNTTVVERIDADGTTLYRVVSTSRPRSAFASDRPRSNYTLSALIDPSGLVYRYHVTYDVHDDRTYHVSRSYRVSRTYHVSRTWRLSAVGSTTVERPPWIEDATNATAGRGG